MSTKLQLATAALWIFTTGVQFGLGVWWLFGLAAVSAVFFSVLAMRAIGRDR